MRFRVQFISEGDEFPINREGYEGGIDLLDRAREFVGIPDLPPESVDDFVGSAIDSAVEIEVSESTARASGLFATTSVATVIVPPHSLEKYVGEKPYLDQRGDKTVVRWKPVIQVDKIVSDWIQAGCPAKWNPDTTNQS